MNINNITYAGRLCADPELRFTPSNVAVCDIRVATNHRVKDKNTGQWSDGPPVFLDVTVWSNSGEAVAKHFKKGDRIYLEGRLSQDEWTDKASQQKRTKIKMVAERWQFVDSKQDDKQATTTTRPQGSRPQPEPIEEDEIPFS